MNRSDAPKKQPVPFAINGQREALLPSSPAGDNTASYDNGFPPVTMILKAAGGLPPKGQDMNQILFELSSLCRWMSSGAINGFDEEFSNSIGGYPKSAVIAGNDGDAIYISTVDANKNNPNTNPSGWINFSKVKSLAALAGGADKLPYLSGPDSFSLTDFTQTGRDILAKGSTADILDYLGLVPAVVLPSGYNIPAHIVNTPGIVYSGQFPGTYVNEPAFGGEWFDIYAAKHVSDACTFIAVSRTGKIATASYSANTFSGWNYGLNSSNTTQAGRDFVAKSSAAEMTKYLGLDVISGRLLNVVKITATGNYTPSAGTKSIIVEAVGGGGASGNLTATASNQNAISAAGSNGAYAKARYTSGFSSVAVSIGTGGAVNGGGGGSGGNGGVTTFGSLLTCPGGNGSMAGIANAPPFNAGAAQPSGNPSGSGIIVSNKGPYSPWPTVVALGMGSNFANCIVPDLGFYGMGGDGVVSDASSAAKSGNAGTAGCVIVWEYA